LQFGESIIGADDMRYFLALRFEEEKKFTIDKLQFYNLEKASQVRAICEIFGMVMGRRKNFKVGKFLK
jgi:hypothetical protein